MSIVHSRELYAEDSKLNERNDCVVRAISVAGCMSYADAHALLRRHGRRWRRGTPIQVTIQAIKEAFGAPCEYIGGIGLSHFAIMHPTGHYVCLTSSHAFALVEGKVYDWAPHPRCRVKWCFKLA